MKIGNFLRDRLLEQNETVVLTPTEAVYFDEHYTYEAVTKKEINTRISRLFKIFKPIL
jgi:hypothetical protein